MKKFIPIDKRSKKEQRAFYASQRGSWNGVVPVTKVIPNKKAYNRKKKLRREEFPTQFFCSCIVCPCFFPCTRVNYSQK